ncbi:MAG: hypothetical protein EBR28_07890 [Planctomycetia bacterium]|nr:hypothetical protein [Planctomycetia bacterium]
MQPPRARIYWFPAKTYGWGWGLPIRWQGWVVLVAFVLVLIALSVLVNPARNPATFVFGVVIASCATVCICWIRGEPPRWRWGEDVESGPGDSAGRR